jgi:hypothetical protein
MVWSFNCCQLDLIKVRVSETGRNVIDTGIMMNEGDFVLLSPDHYHHNSNDQNDDDRDNNSNDDDGTSREA